MKLSPQFASRSSRPSDGGTSGHGAQGGADGETLFAWKGWTNGGGERVSTAAQFSRFAENPAISGTAAPGTAVPVARPATPVAPAPATPVYPTSESALVAPLHAALERLISRGQEQLAVTVRFEQGGSLSLKLTLREGGIATHMQSDVPGLEDALRSAWSSFAQDWNQRGIKLAAPSFGGAATATDLSAGRDGHRSPGQEGQAFFGAGTAPAMTPGRPTVRRAFRSNDSDTAETAIVPGSRVRLTARGLRTWA